MKIAQLTLAGKLHTDTNFNILNFAAEFPPQLMIQNHYVLNSNSSYSAKDDFPQTIKRRYITAVQFLINFVDYPQLIFRVIFD